MSKLNLSHRAKVLLILVDSRTIRGEAGELKCYFMPNRHDVYAAPLRDSLHVYGSGDGAILKMFLRKGLMASVRGRENDRAFRFCGSITELGRAEVERIFNEPGDFAGFLDPRWLEARAETSIK